MHELIDMLSLNDLDACKYANIQLTYFPDVALDEKYYTQLSITMTSCQTMSTKTPETDTPDGIIFGSMWWV